MDKKIIHTSLSAIKKEKAQLEHDIEKTISNFINQFKEKTGIDVMMGTHEYF